MTSSHAIVRALLIGGAFLPACGKSGSGSDSGAGSASSSGETYTSVGNDGLTMELKPDGTIAMSAPGVGASSATYVVDGEKIIVTLPDQAMKPVLIRDGNCIEDNLHIFGRLCKGGKAGEAANVSTRNVPATPSGTYIATNADGEFRLEFKPDNKLTLSLTPPGGAPVSKEGSFTIEGDNVYATLDQSEPLVLKYVNDGYESSSFGLPMRFVKQ